MVVVGCGPLTHFVLAILILGSVLVFFGTPSYGPHPVIDSVSPTLVDGTQSPAAAAGLKAGDAVVSVNGKPVDTADDLVPVLRANAGNPVHVVYVRDGARHETTVTPELATLDGKKVALIGIEIPRTLGYDRANPVTALGRGTRLTADISGAVIARMGQVFGPVGTARLAGQAAASRDWADLLVLFATVNIFVGILNLLPVPPFDGGHVAVALWEKVTRRRVDARHLIPVAAVVMGFLVLFSVSVLYLDLVNPIPNPFR
jgi:RIP metalloprotease RseP